ncbi:MAG: hypothetical protein ACI8TQ_000189 [Planctomycetota bacterium]|jgi:hypothetical protein
MTDERNMDLQETEDLFDFGEIYTPPVSATSVSKTETAPADDAPTFDESDCLFNFDELGAEADTVSVDGASVMASIPEIPTSAVTPAAASASTERVAAPPAPNTSESIEAPLQTQVVVAAPAGFSLRSPVVLILVVTMLINLSVIGFTWRVSDDMRDEFGEATRHIIQATQEIQTKTEANVAKLESFQSPVISEDPEHEHTFERVQLDLDNGDYANARKRLYSLLSIADRLDPDIREKVEATAQYVLADAALKIALAPKEVAQ